MNLYSLTGDKSLDSSKLSVTAKGHCRRPMKLDLPAEEIKTLLEKLKWCYQRLPFKIFRKRKCPPGWLSGERV